MPVRRRWPGSSAFAISAASAAYPSGAPRLDDLFNKAEDAVSSGLLCYVNADIMLTEGLLRAAERVASVSPMMTIGQRWNVDITEPWDFSAGWQQRLERLALEQGFKCGAGAIDYFLFSRGLGRDVLPLALGRTRWDHWLLAHARQRGATLFDATALIVAAHQNHDYSHHREGRKGVWDGRGGRGKPPPDRPFRAASHARQCPPAADADPASSAAIAISGAISPMPGAILAPSATPSGQ